MEPKKNNDANLEKKKTVIFQLGLIVSLALILTLLEWTDYEKIEKDDQIVMMDNMLDEEIMEFEEPPPPPDVPPPPQAPEEIEVLEDDTEEEETVIINIPEPDETTVITIPEPVVEPVKEEIFDVVEEMPEFPGGLEKLYKYLGKNVKYPPMAKENGIQGKVYVNFIVNKDGSVGNIKILRGIGGGCDKEAERVVKAMPKWKPGKQRGKTVKVRYTLPIVFKLQ